MIFNHYHCFVEDLAHGLHDFSADQVKIALTNRAPVPASDQVLGDISELAAGNGYSAGGLAAALSSSAQTSGTYKLVLSSPSNLIATGAVGPFRYEVLYNAVNGALIGYWDRGASATLPAGERLAILLSASAGVFTLTPIA